VKKDKLLPSTLERVGQKLIELRIQKGYKSHETFALDHDLPRVQYWRLEKGRVNFTLRSLHRVLSIHKVTIEDFLANLNNNDNLQ
jgi:hypothetical protein